LIERKSDSFSDAHPGGNAYAMTSNHPYHQIEEYGQFHQRSYQSQKEASKQWNNILTIIFAPET